MGISVIPGLPRDLRDDKYSVIPDLFRDLGSPRDLRDDKHSVIPDLFRSSSRPPSRDLLKKAAIYKQQPLYFDFKIPDIAARFWDDGWGYRCAIPGRRMGKLPNNKIIVLKRVLHKLHKHAQT